MSYTVRLDSRTSKTLDRLSGDLHSRILRKLDALQQNPRPVGVEKLAGMDDVYRVYGSIAFWPPSRLPSSQAKQRNKTIV